MNKNQKGFSVFEVVLIIVVVACLSFAGYRVFAKKGSINISGSEKVGGYSIWLDANQDQSFKTYYSFGMKSNIQNSVPENVDHAKIRVLKIKITSSDSNSINLTASVDTQNWTRPDCSLIESSFCEPPAVQSTIDLPKNIIGKSGTKLINFTIEADGTKKSHFIDNSSYKLVVKDLNKNVTNSVPLYPDGIATAIAVNGGLCQNVSAQQIAGRISKSSLKLASGKYPGIEKVRPNDVLVLANGKHNFDTVLPADASGCEIKVVEANMKQL